MAAFASGPNPPACSTARSAATCVAVAASANSAKMGTRWSATPASSRSSAQRSLHVEDDLSCPVRLGQVHHQVEQPGQQPPVAAGPRRPADEEGDAGRIAQEPAVLRGIPVGRALRRPHPVQEEEVVRHRERPLPLGLPPVPLDPASGTGPCGSENSPRNAVSLSTARPQLFSRCRTTKLSSRAACLGKMSRKASMAARSAGGPGSGDFGSLWLPLGELAA